jgi:hypothetical protein
MGELSKAHKRCGLQKLRNRLDRWDKVKAEILYAIPLLDSVL